MELSGCKNFRERLIRQFQQDCIRFATRWVDRDKQPERYVQCPSKALGKISSKLAIGHNPYTVI
jgi:hypothetical protein